MREHFEAKNHEHAINYLYQIINDDYMLRSIDILSLHGLVLTIEDDFEEELEMLVSESLEQILFRHKC